VKIRSIRVPIKKIFASLRENNAKFYL